VDVVEIWHFGFKAICVERNASNLQPIWPFDWKRKGNERRREDFEHTMISGSEGVISRGGTHTTQEFGDCNFLIAKFGILIENDLCGETQKTSRELGFAIWTDND
jgi:hypothetical protein